MSSYETIQINTNLVQAVDLEDVLQWTMSPQYY